MITADVGVAASAHLLAALRSRARSEGITDAARLKEALQAVLQELLAPVAVPLEVDAHRPFVILLAGVNGGGKTTSIGKLAHYYLGRGKSVLLAAGDTFRAAAREQLVTWGERNNVPVITQKSGDAAAVIFDAVNAAVARGLRIGKRRRSVLPKRGCRCYDQKDEAIRRFRRFRRLNDGCAR